jgi:acyl-CoA synthetase (AMP-forming)/AMP-acid ligase II
MKLVDYIHQNALRHPDKPAVVCDGVVTTYAALSTAIHCRAQRFSAGTLVPFRTTQDTDFLVTYFAIHEAEAVAVPLERTASDAALAAVSALPAAAETTPADILFTTGTTGRSKGVVISHRTILANAENLIEGQGFTSDLLFIVHGPLNHIGSLSKLYPVLMQGATLYILDGLRDMDAFFRALDYPSSPLTSHLSPLTRLATFFVPANIRMLLQFGADRLAQYADRLDFIESGAAPLPHADMLRLCELLPHTRLYNTYASTETGIIATYNYNDGRCLAGCLGRPMSHSRIVITPDGHIACQGDTLMSGYVDDPVLTASVLRDGTVYTSDLGMLDDEGMLHLLGRDSDVINVGGYKVAPSDVEDAAMALPMVKDCICIAVDHPITGQALKLLVVTADGQPPDKRLLARQLSQQLTAYQVPMLYEQVATVRRTYNGKLDRKYYRSE